MAYTPVQSNIPVSGTITTQNLVPGGVATANSAVEITAQGASGLMVQTSGTYTGALSLQVTVDGTNWITVGGLPVLNLNTGGYLVSITSALQSAFQASIVGAVKARITALAAVTGTATVTINLIFGVTASMGMSAPIPTGGNTIGAITLTGTTITGGQTAHSAASTGNPVRIGGRVVPTTAATQDATLVAGDASEIGMSTGLQALTKPFSTAETDWQYAAAASGIVSSTTAVTFKTASGTANIRNYITGVQIIAVGAGTASELCIRDGAAGTVIFRVQIPAAGFTNPLNVTFLTPLRGTANTLMEVVTLVSTATPVYFNAQGYTGF